MESKEGKKRIKRRRLKREDKKLANRIRQLRIQQDLTQTVLQ